MIFILTLTKSNIVIPIFVLTLKGSKREKIIRKNLKKYNLNFKFMYGVNGKNKKNHEYLNQNYNKKKAEFTLGRKMPYSEISASYGHLKIYKYIKRKKIKKALILEDDACPSKSLSEIINFNNLPQKYDLIGLNCYDGFVFKKPDIRILNKYNLHKAKTHLINISAYIISLKACNLILAKTKGKVISVPDWPINFLKHNIVSSVLLPYPVIIDDKNFSYLQLDRSKFTPANKIKKVVPDKILRLFSFAYYLLHIPFIFRRYPSYDFYKEHFVEKKIAFLENIFFNNLINTKEIILNKNFYLKELFPIIEKKLK